MRTVKLRVTVRFSFGVRIMVDVRLGLVSCY